MVGRHIGHSTRDVSRQLRPGNQSQRIFIYLIFIYKPYILCSLNMIVMFFVLSEDITTIMEADKCESGSRGQVLLEQHQFQFLYQFYKVGYLNPWGYIERYMRIRKQHLNTFCLYFIPYANNNKFNSIIINTVIRLFTRAINWFQENSA